jgi:hypothetical protein
VTSLKEALLPFDNEKSPERGPWLDEMQPKRRPSTLVSSRLNDRQRFQRGRKDDFGVQTNNIMSGGLHLVAKTSV